MNRKIVLTVSAAMLMGTLRAESPLNIIQVNLGQVPTLIKEEPKQVREPEADARSVRQESEKPQPKIAENDFEGRLKVIEEKLKSSFKELLDARNKEIEAYKANFFAHLETKLKEAQTCGDLDAYETWNDRKERFQRLQSLNGWTDVLYRCGNKKWWTIVNGMRFDPNDIQGTEVPNFEELYGDSIKKVYQEADKAAEEVQRDALRLGKVEVSKNVREWRNKTLSNNKERSMDFLIRGIRGRE